MPARVPREAAYYPARKGQRPFRALPTRKGERPFRALKAKGLFECSLRLCADSGGRRGAFLEEDHHRDRLDAEAHGEALLLVDVDLDELEVAVALVDDLVEHGRDGVARAAPLSPEVDDHRLVALEHFLLEALFRDSCGHRFLS